VWNYARTPSRGVNEFQATPPLVVLTPPPRQIFVDDILAYSGTLPPAPKRSEAVADWGQTILFCGGPLAEAERSRVLRLPQAEQEVPPPPLVPTFPRFCSSTTTPSWAGSSPPPSGRRLCGPPPAPGGGGGGDLFLELVTIMYFKHRTLYKGGGLKRWEPHDRVV
jgi:hypothetical protein